MIKEINLLPRQHQTHRLLVLHGQSLNNMYHAILIGLFFLAAIYIGTWMLVKHVHSPTAFHLDTATNEAQSSAHSQIKNTNYLLQAAKQSMNQQTFWISHLSEILSQVPVGVFITEIALRQAVQDGQQTHALQVSGIAKSHQSLTEYETRAKKLPWVKKFDAPLRNLAVSEKPTLTFIFNIYK